MGAAAALIFSCLGSAYGSAKSGVGVAHLGIMKPQALIRGMIPVIMAGILGIYGLVVSIIISSSINVKEGYSSTKGFAHLAAGLSAGLASLAAGLSIGVVGDAGVRAFGKQPALYVGLVLMLIFGEVLGLYGLIVALIVIGGAATNGPKCPTFAE
jgi:V-type H+-transporting ATPase proteolipid subunit